MVQYGPIILCRIFARTRARACLYSGYAKNVVYFSADCENYSIRGFRPVIFMPDRPKCCMVLRFYEKFTASGAGEADTPCLILSLRLI